MADAHSSARLVNPPGREVSHPRAQKNERRPDVILATAELLDGARHQRERLVSPAGEDVGGAEGRGDDRGPIDELPRSAEVEASLKDRGRAWEIPATEVDATRRPAPTSPEQTSEVLYTEQNGRAESITVAKPTR